MWKGGWTTLLLKDRMHVAVYMMLSVSEKNQGLGVSCS